MKNNEKIEENKVTKTTKSPKKKFYKISFFKFQLTTSIIILSFLAFLYFFHQYKLSNQEKISSRLVSNYNISKLYANTNNNINTYAENNSRFSVIGLIEIPKIDISYPILSVCNEELLKIAPCKISGPLPNEVGNLCIAGHNYDNLKFFSKISSLNIGDEIVIYDANGNNLSYFVFNKFEVFDNDLSPLSSSNNSKQVTLITCNNSNSKRIIVQAKM